MRGALIGLVLVASPASAHHEAVVVASALPVAGGAAMLAMMAAVAATACRKRIGRALAQVTRWLKEQSR